jgi:hypothetical protein
MEFKMGVKFGVKHFVQDVCDADGNAELKVGKVSSTSIAS